MIRCSEESVRSIVGPSFEREEQQAQTRVRARRLCASNRRLLLADLKNCSTRRDFESGKSIHAKILEKGKCSDIHVATALVNMYAKCGSMVDAHQVFDSIRRPDVVSWTALILGYAENGDGFVALDLFSRMKSQGCAPNSVTYVAALKSCASLALKQDASGRIECLERGKQIHLEVGWRSSLYLQNTLIDMYAKCGSMVDAHRVFDSIKNPDVVSWTVLILGYVEMGKELIALELFTRMKLRRCEPDSRTYVAALQACASLAEKQEGSGRPGCLELAKQIHSEIGCHLDLYVQNSLIDAYSKCGSMVDAHRVFDCIGQPDVVSWNTLLLGYVQNGEAMKALGLFSGMKSVDSVTYLAVLKACASLAEKEDVRGKKECLDRGRQIHSDIGWRLQPHTESALIDMYAKCGAMVDAHRVFDSVRHPDVVSWTALILGYADSGEGLIALDLFSQMKSQGYVPSSITYVAALKACGSLGALQFGREVHADISEFDAILVTCLVDFYAKCGSLAEAQKVFDLHPKTRDLTTWTALLKGYCSFGDTGSVFGLLERLQDDGLQPNAITFQCILMCCGHAGLFETASECFEAMSMKYGVTPSVEHYNCMVDVLGRANKLDGAMALLQKMHCSPNAVTWMTVLGACHKWKEVEIGRLAFHCLLSLDERNATAYVLSKVENQSMDQVRLLGQ